ncbi:Uncharacterised protein [Klebsiella pneumoniae]|nr:Uncharacterised protein [Klebsiella pneumoniae]
MDQRRQPRSAVNGDHPPGMGQQGGQGEIVDIDHPVCRNAVLLAQRINQHTIIAVTTIHRVMLEHQMVFFRRMAGKGADHGFDIVTHIFIRAVVNNLAVVVDLQNRQVVRVVQRFGDMAQHVALLPAIPQLTTAGTDPAAHLIPRGE